MRTTETKSSSSSSHQSQSDKFLGSEIGSVGKCSFELLNHSFTADFWAFQVKLLLFDLMILSTDLFYSTFDIKSQVILNSQDRTILTMENNFFNHSRENKNLPWNVFFFYCIFKIFYWSYWKSLFSGARDINHKLRAFILFSGDSTLFLNTYMV